MREHSTPLNVHIPTTGNVTDDVATNARDYPDSVVCSQRTTHGWTEVTAARFRDEVRAVAKGLVAAGISAGDRVALMSKTRYEWTLIDYAIWFAGAVTVPIYETSSAEQVEWILSDSGARAVVTETAEHMSRVDEGRQNLPDLDHVWSLEANGIVAISSLGALVSDAEIERRRTTSTPDSLATLIYTSGTTGTPKGCMLTHGNLMFELGVALDAMPELFERDDASTLLFLPLAHVFARVIAIGAIKARVRLGHSGDIKNLVGDLQSFQPTFILAVPRVFEKLFNTASQNAAADGRGRIFDRAADTAVAYSRALGAGRPGIALRTRHGVFDRMVYGRLRALLGGRCEYAVSGGAPLGERLGHFYRGIGLVVLEGYGLTETTAALTVNLPGASKVGSVGRPLPGTALRIADDGELMAKGGQVFSGYWRHKDATMEVFDPGGWLRTGDLGEIDDEGFVRITGRMKEIIVTAGGKNVVPSALEDRVRAHHLVSQCMVVGDGRPFIGALVTIDPTALAIWAEQHHKRRDIAKLTEDPDLLAEVAAAIEDANRSVSRAESIRKFAVLPVDWTEEGGQLTPSLKLKRSVVMREFRGEVQALYGL